MKQQLIIIGLDGATFDVIRPLLDQGQLPSIAQLVDNGTSARLLSTIPYATIPAWPSFMTGNNPGKHGVFDFFTLSGSTRRISSSRDICSATLWDILSAEGKRSIVMNVPATYPPIAINGAMVSGMLTPANSQFASPPETMAFLHSETGGYRVSFRSHLDGQQLADDVREVTERQTQGFLALLRRDSDWDFAMLMFRATDVIQHHFWGRPELVQECYRLVDRCIGTIVSAFPGATIFLVSDHGLQTQRYDFHINKWLIDKGYMSIKKGRRTDRSRWEQIRQLDGREELAQEMLSSSKTAQLLLKLGVTGHRLRTLVPRSWRGTVKKSLPRGIKHHIPAGEDVLYDVDWERTQTSAYQLYATESKAIKIVNPDHRTREDLCDELVGALHQLRNQQTGDQVVRHAYRREELYSGPCVGHAPDIVMDLHDGYNVTNAFFADDYVTLRDEVRGCHHREGIFIAAGQDIERGRTLAAPPSLLDIMPTALHHLDATVPPDCDGRVLIEIYDARSEPAARCIRYAPVDETRATTAAMRTGATDGQAEIEERLRALGYL